LITDAMTLGEKFINSIGLTILGMAIVFVVLIILSYALDLLRIIGTDKKKPTSSEEVEQPTNSASAAEVPQEDDGEIIAVITAAIASLSGSSIENFIVKSIKPVPQKNNIWSITGRTERMLNRL